MEKKQKLLILGLGGLAISMADVAEESGQFDVIGFVVNEPPYTKGTNQAGKPVFWIDEVEDLDPGCAAICPLESPRKIHLINRVRTMGIQLVKLIHPTAYISRTVEIGENVIINSGAQIATNCRIGNHVIINRGALIGHDVTINDLCYISPGVNIASHVCVGAKTKIGMGANIIEKTHVGENCLIGAGSLITQDVPDRVKIVGMPARIIEQNIGEF